MSVEAIKKEIEILSKENLIKILNADYNKKEKYKKIKYDLFKNTKSLIQQKKLPQYF